jgi:hypothetical protein
MDQIIQKVRTIETIGLSISSGGVEFMRVVVEEKCLSKTSIDI